MENILPGKMVARNSHGGMGGGRWMGYERTIQGIAVILELLNILTVVVDT